MTASSAPCFHQSANQTVNHSSPSARVLLYSVVYLQNEDYSTFLYHNHRLLNTLLIVIHDTFARRFSLSHSPALSFLPLAPCKTSQIYFISPSFQHSILASDNFDPKDRELKAVFFCLDTFAQSRMTIVLGSHAPHS